MHRDEIEKAYLEELMRNPEGRWILGLLIKQCGWTYTLNRDNATKDAYMAGRRDIIATEIIDRLVKHFGYKSIDIVLEKT